MAINEKEYLLHLYTMKKLVVILVLSFTLLTADTLIAKQNATHEIEWNEFNEGYAKATAEGKIAIIDCYTDWCGWCKVMDKKTFADSSIIAKMNEHFVAIKFNPEIKDKTYIIGSDTLSGPQLLYALSNNKPSGYPTLFYYIPQTKKMYQQPGYQDVEQFHKSLDNLIDYHKKLTAN